MAFDRCLIKDYLLTYLVSQPTDLYNGEGRYDRDDDDDTRVQPAYERLLTTLRHQHQHQHDRWWRGVVGNAFRLK